MWAIVVLRKSDDVFTKEGTRTVVYDADAQWTRATLNLPGARLCPGFGPIPIKSERWLRREGLNKSLPANIYADQKSTRKYYQVRVV